MVEIKKALISKINLNYNEMNFYKYKDNKKIKGTYQRLLFIWVKRFTNHLYKFYKSRNFFGRF